MARIQVLELPSEVVGDIVRTPFVLIIDEADAESPLHSWPEGSPPLRDQVGASAVIVVSDTLDVVRD